MTGDDFIVSKKTAIIAGIAALGGGYLITKKDKMAAETVVFNARGFPKKLRLPDNPSLVYPGVSRIFDTNKGFYYAMSNSWYESADPPITEHNQTDDMTWRDFNSLGDVGYSNAWYKITYKDTAGKNQDEEWWWYFQNLKKPLDEEEMDELEWLEGEPSSVWHKPYGYSDAKSFTKYKAKPITWDEWKNIWAKHITGSHDKRKDYWELYTNGTIESYMDDEESGIYEEKHLPAHFEEVKEATFTLDNSYPFTTEEGQFDYQVKKWNDIIDSTGEWPSDWRHSMDNKNAVVGGWWWADEDADDVPYKLTKDEMKLLLLWNFIKQNLLTREWYDANIGPLINKGWSVTSGRIVQNIRTNWDAYRDNHDTPERIYYKVNNLPTPAKLNEILYSKNLIIKKLLKNRGRFLAAMKNDAVKVENLSANQKDKLAKESAEDIINAYNETPAFKSISYYNYIVQNNNWYEEFINAVNEKIEVGKAFLTTKQIKDIKDKLMETVNYVVQETLKEDKERYEKAVKDAQLYKENFIKEINDKIKV